MTTTLPLPLTRDISQAIAAARDSDAARVRRPVSARVLPETYRALVRAPEPRHSIPTVPPLLVAAALLGLFALTRGGRG